MRMVVTLDMYSGRPNPSWEVSESDAKKLRKLLSKKRAISSVSSPGSIGLLGYRGLLVSSVEDPSAIKTMRAFDGVLEVASLDFPNYLDSDSEIEEFLLGTAGVALKDEERQFIEQEIQKNVSGGVANSIKDFEIMAIPPYDPGKWNNNPTVLRNNNCYNYGNDTITNTFAQPGRGAGQEGPYPPTCKDTSAAAVRDGLKSIPNPDTTPTEGHLVALVVSTTPGFFDYHWYRRDSNGMWSHKPGQTAARNTDNSGRLISDPRNCDRGPYNNFCGFFNSMPGDIIIR
ncbi:hypothetical protein [Pseudomonas rubra]|uniref:Uncharacterized protein n=1 Tax=Pseudomonas rubra TaxID=2942627 RepID=A0ABT5PGI4_9PSED|nr:hypothetical protein [Pseudomonas rubra]MDD1017332.1 hypothetical protein [Pseudomonas rubra]MDD1039122.1 hypothetical protein [Pseudomonas rubra]MDD1156939.1 hypothetical protein [Pseudomonas rubra]